MGGLDVAAAFSVVLDVDASGYGDSDTTDAAVALDWPE